MRNATRGALVFGASIVIAALSTVAHAEKVSRGAVLSGTCFGCHGPDGNSAGAIPTIAGKDAKFIEDQLKAFASGVRPATVMGRHAKGYTDEEIKLIAKFFAGQ